MKKSASNRESGDLGQLAERLQKIIDEYRECSAVDVSVLEDLKYLISEFVENGVHIDEENLFVRFSEDIYDDEMI